MSVVAWVFGGSQGIGRATAVQLAEAGTDVLVLARGQQALEETVTLMQGVRADGRYASAQLDVTDAAAVQSVVSQQIESFGRPQLVISCAGAAVPDYFANIDAEQFERTLRLNLFGTRHVAAAVVPHLERGAVFVATASLAGLIPVFGYSDYSAAKAGVIAFCEVLRAELKPRGIRVQVLCPPDTDTPGFEIENRSKPAETVALSAGAGIATAEQVAGQLLRGLRTGGFLIVAGFEARLAWALKQNAPGLLRLWMDRVIAKARPREQ